MFRRGNPKKRLFHLDELGRDVHEAEVGLENLGHAGLLHLDHHVLARLEPSLVHLYSGRRRRHLFRENSQMLIPRRVVFYASRNNNNNNNNNNRRGVLILELSSSETATATARGAHARVGISPKRSCVLFAPRPNN